MLGKLIKHEFRSTAHSMFGVFLAAGITILIMIAVMMLKIKMLMTLCVVAMIAIIVAVLVITLFSIISSFNKSLYGAQGYLSFTLPVTGKQLLAGKTIVALIWVTISFIFTVAASAFLVFFTISRTSDTLKETIQAIYDMLRTMEDLPDPRTALKVIAVIVFLMLIRALCMIFRVSFSLAVANTRRFQKYNPIMIGIFVYVGLFVILMIAQVCAMQIPVGVAVSGSGLKVVTGETFNHLMYDDISGIPPIPFLGYVFEIVMSALLYVVTGNIMTDHVNIK